MKARKVQNYNDLIGQIVEQIKLFKPDMRMIKKRIENLMERGFMKKDEEDRTKLIYIP